MGKYRRCAGCGYSGPAPLHEHHVKGRKNSDETIDLCPNCHAEYHAIMLLVDNAASRAAKREWESLEDRRFVSRREKETILAKNGYKPRFDGEPMPEWF